MEVLLSWSLAAQVAIVAGVGFLAFQIFAIRNDLLPKILAELQRSSKYQGMYRSWRVDDHPDDHDTRAHRTVGTFVIWEWRGGDWKPRDVPKGVKADVPPAFPGAFDGDMAKTWVAINRQ